MINDENSFSNDEFYSFGNNLGAVDYVKATSDTWFRNMNSDDHVATSLINNILEDAGVNIVIPLRIIGKGDPNVLLRGLNVNAIMDYHAIADDGQHVVVEMQAINHDNFDRHDLFYAASAFANQAFLREPRIGG
jgi:hypothetical protein